jgi:hypothetical protein
LRLSARPIEDLGIQPDVPYRVTKRDLLEDNIDLMNKAGELLASQKPRTLDVKATLLETPAAKLAVRTENIASLDIYVNDRPVAGTLKVSNGTQSATVPLGDATERPHVDTVRLEGFDAAGKLVAARTITLRR